MSKCLVLFVEGDTEVEFYKQVIANARKLRPNGMFDTNIECKSINGVGAFKNIVLRKFVKEIKTKYDADCVFTVVLCRDTDVFELSHKPPIKWDEVERDLRANGAADVIHVEARHSIEDWFLYDAGNTNASMVAVDIYKKCYPKIEVEAYGIELQLYEDVSKQKFIIVNMTDDVRKKYMKEAINLMLEICGKCYVYDDVIQIEKTIKRKRCNWEMLPPGEMPSRHVEKQLELMKLKKQY